MSRLLITGGAGFIGANFVHYWHRHYPDDRLVVLDALTYAGNPANLAGLRQEPTFRFVHGDICDTDLVEDLLASERIETLVHFAAESHVDRSITGPAAFIKTNISGTFSLLQAAAKVWLQPGQESDAVLFHHVSTDEVYGFLGPNDPPFSETTPYAPSSPYSASKAASDHLVRAWHHTYGLPVTISNCSNNYGPLQYPEKLIPLMFQQALRGEPLPVYGDGSNIRDWLHVEDHCRGIELIIKKGRHGETYNIGGNSERSNLAIVRLICSHIDRRFAEQPGLAARYPRCPAATGGSCAELINFVTDRPGHDWRYAINADKIGRELGYAPTRTFEHGISETLDGYFQALAPELRHGKR